MLATSRTSAVAEASKYCMRCAQKMPHTVVVVADKADGWVVYTCQSCLTITRGREVDVEAARLIDPPRETL